MKFIKTYEVFDDSDVKVGDILKRNTVDYFKYNLYLITNILPKPSKKKYEILYIGEISTDLDNLKLKPNDDVYHMDNWFKGEYETLESKDEDVLYKEFQNPDNDWIINKIKNITNIDLTNYALSKNISKYNL